MQHVHAAETAFAAIRDDGSVVTWGHPEYGGVSAVVQDRLSSLESVGRIEHDQEHPGNKRKQDKIRSEIS